ncbi:MAG: prephenate dehydratase, partial [Pirellulaceae bacterium]
AGRAAVTPHAMEKRLISLAENAKGPLEPLTIKRILLELARAEAALLSPTSVSYLGPKYSYSHLAAMERFSGTTTLNPVATIATVFEDVHDGRTEFGLVPLENSTDGRVVDTLGMFTRLPVRICGEVQLRIHHNLLAKSPAVKIREIHSKPQALSQCRQWLTKHFPQARLVHAASTTEAACLASTKSTIAAVASLPAAEEYGLQIIAANIEDNPDNITRFAVIGDSPSPRTKGAKTSLMFEISHRPGGLADMMAIFKRNRLNLTWIESFPLAGRAQEYLFFIELEGHQLEPRVKRALSSLERKSVRLEILGSYPASLPLS